MPCNDNRGPIDDCSYVERRAELAEARLCAVFTVLEKERELNTLLGKVDWKEAGTTLTDTRAWWTRHKEADRARRVEEAKRVARRLERQKVLASLTPQQRKVLGLK